MPYSCPDCREKEEKIKELEKLLILIVHSYENNTSAIVFGKLIEKAREMTEDAEV